MNQNDRTAPKPPKIKHQNPHRFFCTFFTKMAFLEDGRQKPIFWSFIAVINRAQRPKILGGIIL